MIKDQWYFDFIEKNNKHFQNKDVNTYIKSKTQVIKKNQKH